MADKQIIDAMWDDSPVDVSTEVNFIWSIANKLRGPYRSDKYKDVIIPMTIIRRFECALAPTKQKVVEQFKANPNFPAKAMYRISGFQFYNTSEFDLAELVNDADHIAANFKSYLQGFSANVLEILMSKERGLNFGEEIDKMDKNNRLLSVIKAFSELDLNPRTIDNVWMLENDLIEAIIALPTDLFYNTGIATYIWVLSKNKRPERKGKIQLIDASTFFKKLRKALGDKKNEISPEDRSAVTQLYADFAENEYCKIYDNEEFIYREYTVMQPLQRSYAITEERMEAMLSKGALSSLYDQAKVDELENAEELTGKDQKKLEAYQNNQPVYEAIVSALKASVSEQVYNTPAAFLPVLTKALSSVTADKKLIEKIADGLSAMDKNAEIQRDRKGNIIYDKETKDTELVKWEESIEDYMAREVLPHIPDAAAFFEEDLGKKKPVIKTGAEIPFTRYFYKYQPSTPSEELEIRFKELELSVTERVAKLFE